MKDFEGGDRKPIANNLEAMRRAIESAGIRLVFQVDGSVAGIAVSDISDAAARQSES